jgi:hypothetical protein
VLDFESLREMRPKVRFEILNSASGGPGTGNTATWKATEGRVKGLEGSIAKRPTNDERSALLVVG